MTNSEYEGPPHPNPPPLPKGLERIVRLGHPVIISHPSKRTIVVPDIQTAAKRTKFSVEEIVLAIDEGHALGGRFFDWAMPSQPAQKKATPAHRHRGRLI